MAYEKTNWTDRVVQKPRTYTMQNNSDGTVTLTPAPGTVTQAGTPVNAANLNKIENELVTLEDEDAELKEEITNIDNKIYGNISALDTTFANGWNLVDGALFSEGKMVNDNGTISDNATFYLAKVKVKANTTYYCYDSALTNKEIRRIVLLDSDELNPIASQYVKTIIPTVDGYAILMFTYINGKHGNVYFTDKPEKERIITIPELNIFQNQIIGAKSDILAEEKRICAINFQFDDCHENDANIVNIFDSKMRNVDLLLSHPVKTEVQKVLHIYHTKIKDMKFFLTAPMAQKWTL